MVNRPYVTKQGQHFLQFVYNRLSAVQYNDWLEEECDNMAREGLRTLVVAKKTLSQEQYEDFERRYNEAKLSIHDRARQVKLLTVNTAPR